MKVCRNGVKISVGAVVDVPDIIVPIYGTVLSTWSVCIYKRICFCSITDIKYIDICKRGERLQPLFLSRIYLYRLYLFRFRFIKIYPESIYLDVSNISI